MGGCFQGFQKVCGFSIKDVVGFNHDVYKPVEVFSAFSVCLLAMCSITLVTLDSVSSSISSISVVAFSVFGVFFLLFVLLASFRSSMCCFRFGFLFSV